MRCRLVSCALSLFTATALAWPAPAAPAAPPHGPGAVLEAAKAILAAIEAGDRAALERAFDPMPAQAGVAYAAGADGELELAASGGEIVFADLDVDGRPVVADTRAGALEALLGKVGGDGVAIAHRITAVRADCPGELCSWAAIDFERTTQRGEQKSVRAMRAVLLTRYRAAAGEPPMRAFLWQAALR